MREPGFAFFAASLRAKKFRGRTMLSGGWSWTAGTASWVEPTAYALLVLRAAPKDLMPSKAASRSESCRGDAFRSHVSRRRMELRQSDGLRRSRRTASQHHRVGASRVSRTHAANRDSAKSRVAREKLEQHPKPRVARADANCAQCIRTRQSRIQATLERLYEPDAIAWTVPVAAWAALAASGQKFWSQPARAEAKN